MSIRDRQRAARDRAKTKRTQAKSKKKHKLDAEAMKRIVAAAIRRRIVKKK